VGVAPWCLMCVPARGSAHAPCRSPRDCLRGTGGVAVLLPLLVQPAAAPPSASGKAVVEALHLIAAFCDAHAPNQSEFARVQASRMIACALARLPAEVRARARRATGDSFGVGRRGGGWRSWTTAGPWPGPCTRWCAR
jgi:hypothetical protein